MRIIMALLAAALLSGCVSTAVDVITLPARAVGQGVDWATTSQDEADRNRGRKLREQEARDAKERRREDKRRRKAERAGR